jgi:4-carboxymuconolactone decarboxylase
MENELYQKGIKLYKQMYGDGRGDLDDLGLPNDDPIRNELISWCYGNLMERGVISKKVRTLAAVAMMTCLSREDMLHDWIKGALNLGCSKEEVTETIITMTIYAGFPVTRKGLKIAKAVFAEMGI